MTYAATRPIATGAAMTQAVRLIPTRYAVTCSPPLRLSDPPRYPGAQPGIRHDYLVDGLYRSQYDHLKAVLWSYYAGLWGVLDPLPSGVGKGTDYNRLNTKRHKPESKPPPPASDLDEPDWRAVRLAQAIESLTVTEQRMIRMKIQLKLTNQAIGDAIGQSERWVVGRWGNLATWLYYREQGLVE